MGDSQEPVVEDALAGAITAPTLHEVLAPLLGIPQNQRKFSCRALLKCLEQLEHVEQQLLTRKSPEEETLADQDR